jgi:3-methyladenine DNA glycosylase AlkD
MKQKDNQIIDTLRQELAKHNKPENLSNYQRFFKEKLDHPIGLKVPVLRKISNSCYKEIKNLPGKDILAIGDQLLASGERYMRFFAFEWAIKVKDQYTKGDFKRFEAWLKKYVDNWGSCDHISCGPMGLLILQYPDLSAKMKVWTKSKNRWMRRAAAVSLIAPVRKRILLNEVFKTADILLVDSDDMVQKGYGWMLKEASNEYPKEVFDFVMKHKAKMPRTALRYAIEKLPADKRKKAMKKD